MTRPRKKPEWKPVGGTGIAEGMGFQVVSRDLSRPTPEPPRTPTPGPNLATRSEAECRELARRQRGGEDLGLTDAFVSEWAPE